MTPGDGTPSRLQDARPVFVVGPSRSGTTMVMDVLRKHPALHVSTETHYFDDLRRSMNGRHQSPLAAEDRMMCEDYFLSIAHAGYGRAGDPSRSPMDRLELRARALALGDGSDAYFAAFCSLQAAANGRERWGEKTPRHAFCIDEMLACFPHAKVLGLVRDPRAVIASYRDNARTRSATAGHTQTHQRLLRWQRSYDLAVASLLWRSTLNNMAAAVDRYGSARVRLVRYEDIVSAPRETLGGITTWLDIKYSDAMIEVDVRNSTYVESGSAAGISGASLERWRRNLSNDEIATIQILCRRGMREHRYAAVSTPAAHVPVAINLLRLPSSAVRATLANRDRSGALVPYIWRRVRGVIANPNS